ncbi:MAG: hypothetical protein AB7V77_01815 [Candidatus Woesearchaeota archaeon]
MVSHNKKESKKETSKGQIFSIVIAAIIMLIVAILLFTTLGDNVKEKQDYRTYNKFEFQKDGDYWRTLIYRNDKPFDAVFYNHPLDCENVIYDDNATILTIEKPHTDLIISIDLNSTSKAVIAGANIGRITGKFYELPTSSALYIKKEERYKYNFSHQIVDCSDATELKPIIYINDHMNISGVFLNEENPNCIEIFGQTPDEVIKFADTYSYKIIGIMK